jgi:ectoine hydroxylase-related dioxygenase (phytanoyl-CoA dioxygenase family)
VRRASWFTGRGLDEWRSRGWAVARNFIDEERLAALRTASDRLNANPLLFEQRGAVRASAPRTDRLDPVIDLAPGFRALAADPDLIELLGEALGGEVQLMKDKYIAKPAGAGGYALHIDAAYWLGMDLDLDRVASAIVFLDDATLDNGAIECADGWHPLAAPGEPIVDPAEGSVGPLAAVEAQAGDVLLLHARTPHRSGTNRSTAPRRTLMLTYGIDARPGLYGLYQQHRRGPDDRQ